jgi:hypothetical protein
MYLGVALSMTILFLGGRLRRTLMPPWRVLLALIMLVVFMGIDGINSYLHFFPAAAHLYEPQNWLRLATGLGTGIAMGLILEPTLAQVLWRRPQIAPPISSLGELLALLAAGAALGLLVISNQPVLLYVLALSSVGGLLLIVAALNTTVLLVIMRREGRADLWRQAALPFGLGLVFAVAELGFVAAVRFGLTGTMTGFPGL